MSTYKAAVKSLESGLAKWIDEDGMVQLGDVLRTECVRDTTIYTVQWHDSDEPKSHTLDSLVQHWPEEVRR